MSYAAVAALTIPQLLHALGQDPDAVDPAATLAEARERAFDAVAERLDVDPEALAAMDPAIIVAACQAMGKQPPKVEQVPGLVADYLKARCRSPSS